MTYFTIRGGKPLAGEISINGAKNHVLKVLPASLLCRGTVTLTNVPAIEDVFRARELLGAVGSVIQERGPHELVVCSPERIKTAELPRTIAEQFRASLLFVGPILARNGRVRFPYPGGCVIGRRPIDLFLEGWRAMGVRISESKAGFDLRASRLRGIDYTFRIVSHTGTEGLLLTAVLATGKTVLRNAALEPEIVALARFLNSCGARIQGAGTPTLTIEGTGGTLLSGGSCVIIPDRLETGSFAILAGLLGSDVRITNCDPSHIESLIAHLHKAGVFIEQGVNWLHVRKAKKLMPVSLRTHEYPGFATDHQAPFTVLLTQAHGASLVFETVFEGRLSYVEDLNRMGAHITQCDLHRALVFGPTPLGARNLESPDLRAGIAFVIAALIAKGVSRIGNAYQIDRGYEKLDERLRTIGADITRED